MYLKSLTLRGFKSFASSTTLKFEPGITAVVGPNGSGKSNVVDALAWVMGEQGAKSLRGGKMEDVIFAGTANRAPLGRAEVVLTIDNADGALPIDYTEVTISRLMFRSGSSEYAINGDSCRLLDIQELLSDSGIGREMHVIIGQGQLDRVLHSGPEGRRAVIEEAAGVLKHRKRKEKALRKLDAMQGNLTRVQDLTGELRRQLKPLGKQAEIARKAAVIQADWRDARLRLLADDLVTLRTRLEQEAADEAQIRERRTETERGLAEAQEREETLEAAEAVEAPKLKQVQDTWYRLSALQERLRGVADLAAERHRNAAEARDDERRGRDPQDMEREAAEIREQEEMLRAALDEAQDGLADDRGGADGRRGGPRGRGAAAAGRRARAADRREELARLRAASRRCASRPRRDGRRSGGSPTRGRRRSSGPRRRGPSSRRSRPRSSRIPRWPPSTRRRRRRSPTAKDAAERARAAVAGPRGAVKEARQASPPRAAPTTPRRSGSRRCRRASSVQPDAVRRPPTARGAAGGARTAPSTGCSAPLRRC
ncbi:chromosome segregation SMC family protein [Actinomadura sp. CNU-125]|uniref:chromosome segregation SMC family protein n=1 Tax=Actinomadura sp. CNU-125 TaxID=1904961 RepID=UPI000A7F93B6|nr:AAA family ATPase [Actinomadura sp. CNU-125]